MSSTRRFPTRRELEQGVVIECHGSDDPDLRELRATRLKLHAYELYPLIDDDPLDPGQRDRARGAQGRRLREVDEDLVDVDVEVLAWLPGRRRWFRVGSFYEGFRSPWRTIDAALVEDYLGRLARARGLAHLVDDCGS